jgi:hypothetical protein
VDIALERIEGHTAWVGDAGVAWFTLPPVRWSYRAKDNRESLMLTAAANYAELAGRNLHLRVTTRPYPVTEWAKAEWAAAHDAFTPGPLPGFAEHLRTDQRHLLRLTLADKAVYLGIGLRSPRRRAEELADELTDLARVMGGGLDATPASASELEWLLHRSAALGMPAPVTMPPAVDVLEASDLPEIIDLVHWATEPYGQSVEIRAEVDDVPLRRHVVVLTTGRMSDLHIPERMGPWLQRVERLSFPVEISARIEVVEPERSAKFFRDAVLTVRSQVAHYLEHHEDPPEQLARQHDQARAAEDEVRTSFDGLSVRTRCWVRFAVSGNTACTCQLPNADTDRCPNKKEALARANELRRLYAPAITIVRPAGQYALAREFIPGEPQASTAHRRDMPVLHLAGGVPNATAMVGYSHGMHLGETCGDSERAVLYDTHHAITAEERSGLTLLAGTLGSGKSALLASIVYQSVLRGVPWVVLDPSGPLAKLCDILELREHAEHVDLLNAKQGTLNPYRVVPEPKEDHFETAEEWNRARTRAAAQRKTLCKDVLLAMLPFELTQDPKVAMAIGGAIRTVGGSCTAAPMWVVRALREQDGSDIAYLVADELEEISEHPYAALVFANAMDYGPREDDWARLTVLTMRGLVAPEPDSPRSEWTYEERFGLVALNLAANLATRAIYDRPMKMLKGFATDEAHALARIPSGRALLNRTARDTRKHRTRAIYGTHSVSDLKVAHLGNLIGDVFIGHTEDPDAQVDALRTLGVPRGVGYESGLAKLSEKGRKKGKHGIREFVYADGRGGRGGIEKFRPDVRRIPTLAAAVGVDSD